MISTMVTEIACEKYLEMLKYKSCFINTMNVILIKYNLQNLTFINVISPHQCLMVLHVYVVFDLYGNKTN